MNPWLFSFLISIVLLVLLINWNHFSVNIYGGLISAFFMIMQNLIVHSTGLWEYHQASLFANKVIFSNYLNVFIIGIAFSMGTLFFQFLPKNLYIQLIHAFMWTLLFILFKYLASQYNLITYYHFNNLTNTHVLVFFLSLAWFKNTFLKTN